jgi:putative ABC transport system substrate-binding protein
MKRREFITLVAVAAWPLAGEAQQAAQMRLIGVQVDLPEEDSDAKVWLAAFQQELAKLGWADGQNIKIEYRWANDIRDIRANAAELVALSPALIVCRGSLALAALRIDTSTVPVVFIAVSDPVAQGVVSSFIQGATLLDLPIMKSLCMPSWSSFFGRFCLQCLA